MLKLCRIALFSAVLGMCASSQAAHDVADPARFVTEAVSVGGAVEHKLTLSVADLRAFAPHQLGDVPLICQSGADMGKLEKFKGVQLRAILEKAGIVAPGHNDVKKMVIVARASDGYAVVYSYTEVFNSPIGEGVFVFYEKDGKPLGDDEGRIAMVSTRDTRTGPRHVKWLQSLEVRQIVD